MQGTRVVLLVVCGIVGCGGSPPPPPSTRPVPAAAATAPATPAPTPAAPAEPPTPVVPSLASRLGGRDGIARVVHGTIERVLQDPALGRAVSTTDRAALEAGVTDDVCIAAGGDCRPSGPGVEGMWAAPIRDRDYDRFLGHLAEATAEAGFGDVEKNELLAIIGPLRARVVGGAPAREPAAPDR